MSDPNDSTGTVSLSSTFREFCRNVRNNDPSILPEPGEPLRIANLSEKEDMELADALLENTSVTFLQLEMERNRYSKSSAEAMAKYVSTSKRLQRVIWKGEIDGERRELRPCEDMLCCFLPAFQESTSLRELYMELPFQGGPSNLAFINMLTHTQTLRSLSLSCLNMEDWAVAAALSGLKKNTTVRELTLHFLQSVSPILTSLRDHPLLRRLCLYGHVVDLTGLDTLLLSETSKITELDIRGCNVVPIVGLTRTLQALQRRPALTKLGLDGCRLSRDDARQLGIVLCNTPSLQSLDLANNYLGSAELAELAPALYRNTSIKVLNMSKNNLIDMESARLICGIIRSNKTITTLDLSINPFGRTTGALECIAEGLGSNSTLMEIRLLACALIDRGVSTLAQTPGSRNTTLQKLKLGWNGITSTGIGVLVEMMEQNSHHITDLDLRHNPIGIEGASLIARSLGNNALPNLTRLSLYNCVFSDDGFIALMSALTQNTSLLQLDLRNIHDFRYSERAFLALAESLPDMNVVQRVDLSWCQDLASAMPLLLVGLCKNTSLFRFHVADCKPRLVPRTTGETARYAGGWIQEMERLGYRNRCLHLIRTPREVLPPRGVWPHALARIATFPYVIFEALRSKPSLVPSKDTGIPT
jgi:hypothetical protein